MSFGVCPVVPSPLVSKVPSRMRTFRGFFEHRAFTFTPAVQFYNTGWPLCPFTVQSTWRMYDFRLPLRDLFRPLLLASRNLFSPLTGAYSMFSLWYISRDLFCFVPLAHSFLSRRGISSNLSIPLTLAYFMFSLWCASSQLFIPLPSEPSLLPV